MPCAQAAGQSLRQLCVACRAFDPFTVYRMPPTEMCETVPAANSAHRSRPRHAAGTVSHFSV